VLSGLKREVIEKDVNEFSKKLDRFKADAGFSSRKGSMPPSGYNVPTENINLLTPRSSENFVRE
jgi:hypothetical protein